MFHNFNTAQTMTISQLWKTFINHLPVYILLRSWEVVIHWFFEINIFLKHKLEVIFVGIIPSKQREHILKLFNM